MYSLVPDHSGASSGVVWERDYIALVCGCGVQCIREMAESNSSQLKAELVVGSSHTPPPLTHEGTGCANPLKPFRKNGEQSVPHDRHEHSMPPNAC